MKLKIFLFLITVFFLPVKAAEVFNFTNQAGSSMSFAIDEKGAIKGSYISALGCGIGKKRPLTGWRNAKAITFSVNFEDCGSVTSWVGHSSDLKEIETIWTLVRGDESWDMKLTGISHFKRIKSDN